MKDIIITFHIEGTKQPVALDITKAGAFAKELEQAGKKWRLGKTI